MTNKLRIYGILMLICVAASCSRVPKHIISEKKMRTVLYDMQIAEAIVETNNESYRTGDERQTVYDAVFAKHHITQAEYDSSLVWYGEHMDIYMRIYRMTLKDVNENIALLGDIKPNPLSGDLSAKDSVDVWVYSRHHSFRPERGTLNMLTFDISPQKPYSSGSSYVFGFSVWGVSADMKHKPRIHINAVQADTVISVSNEITGDGYYETVLRTVATKQVKRVYGYILMNDPTASCRIYMDDMKLMKYNYGSKALTAPQPDTALSVSDTLDVKTEH
ncbi:MAG: DUF4296 domain-containing protein [Tannerella sp.]|nr:DUF4296 domain-containing protein [Tannerella sp.]